MLDEPDGPWPRLIFFLRENRVVSGALSGKDPPSSPGSDARQSAKSIRTCHGGGGRTAWASFMDLRGSRRGASAGQRNSSRPAARDVSILSAADLRHMAAIDKLMSEVLAWGSPSVLVNKRGHPAHRLDREHCRTNLGRHPRREPIGGLSHHCANLFAAHGAGNGFGRVINIASVHGLVGSVEQVGPYVAAKFGLVGLSKVAAPGICRRRQRPESGGVNRQLHLSRLGWTTGPGGPPPDSGNVSRAIGESRLKGPYRGPCSWKNNPQRAFVHRLRRSHDFGRVSSCHSRRAQY